MTYCKALGLAVALIMSWGAGSAAAAEKPNIVLILADDLDATTSSYWERADARGEDDPLKKTRALIKERGMTYTNAFAPTPICCPARSTLLTGKYGHNTGVLTNGGDNGGWAAFVRNGNEQNTVATWLSGEGYRTALVGKYLNGLSEAPLHIPPGWTEWNAFVDPRLGEYMGYEYDVNENGTIRHYGLGEVDYSTDYVARKSVDFIRRAAADDKPFFIFVSPTAPHLPLPPARRHRDHPYRSAAVPKTDNYNEPDVSDKSAWLRLSAAKRAALVNEWNPIDYRLRQGSLYALDDLVESVVTVLADTGELANTYLIFMSDNGYNLGAHRLINKQAPYEESIRVPLTIAGPRIEPGSSTDKMVLETDIAPTIATWAGIAIPEDIDGLPLQPLLAGNTNTPWRNDFIVQYVPSGLLNGIGAEIPPAFWSLSALEVANYRGLREQRYKLVEFYDSERFSNVHEYELYDLDADPTETKNLLATLRGRLKYAATVSRMKKRLNELAACKGVTCR